MSCRQNTAGFSTPRAWSEVLPLPSARTPKAWSDSLPSKVASGVENWSDTLPLPVAATPDSWQPKCAQEAVPTNALYTFAGDILILFRVQNTDATIITTF